MFFNLFFRKSLYAALLLFAAQAFAAEKNGTSVLNPPQVQREFRGVWVATVANIDWPSAPGLPVEQQKKELLDILQQSKKLNLNAVVFQVRPACDALYASKIEPWSEYLTGQMGKAPEPFYDPLQFAVEEAHKLGLELHAWINPYRARHTTAKSAVSEQHVSKSRPDLVVQYGKHLWLDPGQKAVQDYSISVVMDIVKRYDVDGIHLDDYFYPYKERDEKGELIQFPDETTFMKYVAKGGLSTIDDWRRENVNTFIERCYKAVKAEKRWVKFGVSPFGIWQPGFPEQIKGFNAYEEIYCDSRKWLESGWLDYSSPQLYWKIEATAQSYPVLLKWWTEQNVKHRHIWPGNFTSKVGDAWTPDELINQIKATREQSGAGGNIHFSMKPLMRNKADLSTQLMNTVYKAPALIPASPWIDKTVPGTPTVSTKRAGKNLQVQWSPAAQSNAAQWLLQKRVGGVWTSEIYGGMENSILIAANENGALPDAVALTAVSRSGMASVPAVFEVR